jgi:hypothetical protein
MLELETKYFTLNADEIKFHKRGIRISYYI